jgi:hypothetical protein
MHAEFPPTFIANNDTPQLGHTRDMRACEMLRCGVPCGNETYYSYVGSCAVAVCMNCQIEVELSGSEVTQYWREKQKEWGVR